MFHIKGQPLTNQGSMYGLFTYIWLICPVNEGKYASPMDPRGIIDFHFVHPHPLLVVGR